MLTQLAETLRRHAWAPLLLVALLHGLIYVFLVPPWQHYDEPNHFEYAWLLAQRGTIPKPGDYDAAMRLQVAQSMIAHDFFQGMSFYPDLSAEPVWIGGYSQLGDPPGYYLVAALPLILAQDADITWQLYAARLASLVLYLLTILAAYGLSGELLPCAHPLRWLLPLSAALLPGFNDLMTAVNSDVGAVAAFSWCLWACVRLVRRRFSWPTLLWGAAAALACVFTKPNVMVAAPLLVLSLLVALCRQTWRRLLWAGLAGAALLGLAVAMSWGDAALWYRHTSQPLDSRQTLSPAPVGSNAFAVQVYAGGLCPQECRLIQLLPAETGAALQGQRLTLGAWIWATRPVSVHTPALVLADGNQQYYQTVEVGQTPAFYAFSFQPLGNTRRAWVVLSPGLAAEGVELTVFYDGIVLAYGDRPAAAPPAFDDPQALSGSWGGEPFANVVRNPSAEAAWPRFCSWVDTLGANFFPDRGRPSIILYSLLDVPTAYRYYAQTSRVMLHTFWARFGWGHVPLLGHKPYRYLGVVTLLAVPGVAWLAWRWRKSLPWDALILLGLAAALVWGLAVTRGTFYLIYTPYIPVARYAYPAIIPTLLILSAGWVAGLRSLCRLVRCPAWSWPLIYVGLFLILDVYALASLRAYYAA